MAQRLGRYTLKLERCPVILGSGTIGGKKESQGPLASYFDLLEEDTTFGEASWEKAESYLQKSAVEKALEHSGLSAADMDYVFAGDLLNQCTSSTFGLKNFDIPFVGLYGACSTMAESLAVASCFVEGGLARRCIAVTSSHFCSAERQFRFPLEYGGQRTPSAQWTATASGACVVGEGTGPASRRLLLEKYAISAYTM